MGCSWYLKMRCFIMCCLIVVAIQIFLPAFRYSAVWDSNEPSQNSSAKLIPALSGPARTGLTSQKQLWLGFFSYASPACQWPNSGCCWAWWDDSWPNLVMTFGILWHCWASFQLNNYHEISRAGDWFPEPKRKSAAHVICPVRVLSWNLPTLRPISKLEGALDYQGDLTGFEVWVQGIPGMMGIG